MSESLHELEAALADAQREAALAEDEWTRRRQRYDAKPTENRLQHMLDANRTAYVTKGAFYRAQEAVERARRKAAEHPPLKEGLSTRVTDEDLATLRAEGQLFDVAAADAVDELDNPAAPIVEVDAPGRHRAYDDDGSGPTAEDVAYHDVPAEGHESRGTCTVCGTEVAWGSRCHDHPAAGPNAVPEPDTSTPVVTLAPVNGEGRFVPTADVDLPVLEDTREWTPIGTIADGPAEGATAYMSPVAELGYTRNEQGAYEYDGPVGEQPDVPAWDGVTPAPGNPEWESTIRNLYGISADVPIVAHKEMWTTWDGRTRSRTSYKPGDAPKEPNVITVDHNRADRFYGLPVYVREGVAADTVYVLREDGDGGAVLMNPETFEGLKAKLDAVRNVARSVDALDGVGDPVTKAEADEAMGPTAEEQEVIDAGKAAQERWDAQVWNMLPWGQFGYTEAFAKAGDVPSAPSDHVTGVTDPESVTVDTERDVQQFGSDTVKLKSQTITGSFTMTEARPEFFQKVFPNARVVIGSNGKVEITANSVENTAKAESKPTTPEGKLLAEAAQIIGHDRNDQYGNAEDSFGVIAEFWSTWLTARWREVFDHNMDSDEYTRGYINLTAADVANMLGLMKKARTAVGGYKHDSYVDEAGYVALAERCEAKGSGL